jgi:hypothetical protein
LLKLLAMNDYSAIDPYLVALGPKPRGCTSTPATGKNVVRSVTIYVWMDTRHESTGHIWLDPPNDLGLVGVHAAHRASASTKPVP